MKSLSSCLVNYREKLLTQLVAMKHIRLKRATIGYLSKFHCLGEWMGIGGGSPAELWRIEYRIRERKGHAGRVGSSVLKLWEVLSPFKTLVFYAIVFFLSVRIVTFYLDDVIGDGHRIYRLLWSFTVRLFFSLKIK